MVEVVLGGGGKGSESEVELLTLPVKEEDLVVEDTAKDLRLGQGKLAYSREKATKITFHTHSVGNNETFTSIIE